MADTTDAQFSTDNMREPNRSTDGFAGRVMYVQPLTHWLVAAALFTQTAAGAAPSAPDLPVLNVTRNTLFRIPFQVAPSSDPAQQPVEVQLHVSNDRGAHWQLYAKAPPTQREFLFRAGGDGEYWFALRTIDGSGRGQPDSIGAPGLRVQIDTRPPTVKLAANVVQPKQVNVRWEVDKSTVKPESLSIQYRALPKGAWQAVSTQPPNGPATNRATAGETSIWLKPGEDNIQVRAEILDTAGNMGFAQTQIAADNSLNSRQITASIPAQATPAQSTPAQLPNPNSPMPPVPPSQPPKAELTIRNASPLSPAGMARAESLTGSNASKDIESGVAKPDGSVAISISPAIGPDFAAVRRSSSQSPTIPGLPPGEKPRMVNSKLFELDYDVDSVGPSGIGRVELWATRDGGKTWHRHMTAADQRSPILVSVEEEGVYGFRAVVTNGAGVGATPPSSGDLPDVWVGVDVTRPTAKITAVQQGVDAEAGRVIISWQADDWMLAPRPISLSFSQDHAGPWLPVASGLENTGRYAWPMDSRTPPQIYVRLEVRDAAGNLSICDTAEPLSVDLSQPSIRVRDVRSLGHTGSRPVRDSSRR